MTRNTISPTLLASVALILLSGCATIFSSGPDTLTLESDPPGANYQYGPYQGRTPDTIAVSRKVVAGSQVVSFQKRGYDTRTMPIETGIQGVTWLDILVWPGFIVDFATGNAYRIEQPVVKGILTPIAAADATGTTAASTKRD